MSHSRNFTVVLRGPSAVIFRSGIPLLFNQFPTMFGPVQIAYTTRWLKTNGASTIPGHIWLEVKGSALEFESAIGVFANAGISGLSVISTSANASIGEPEVEVAFECGEGVKSREYFQSYVAPEGHVVHTGRVVDMPATVNLLHAIDINSEKDRLLRAIHQYAFALRNWKFGHATIALAHLWMAVEALTKAQIRVECSSRGLFNPEELAKSLDIEIKDLDRTIRRDFLLQGDNECYRNAKKASDGFEHGFLGFDEVMELAQEIRDRMAAYVRTAIFDLAKIDEKTRATLLGDNYLKPMGHWPLTKYLRGTLEGEGPELAKPKNEYPFIKWSSTVREVQLNEDGRLDIKIDDTFTAELAEGISFKPKSVEVWEPN